MSTTNRGAILTLYVKDDKTYEVNFGPSSRDCATFKEAKAAMIEALDNEAYADGEELIGWLDQSWSWDTEHGDRR